MPSGKRYSLYFSSFLKQVEAVSRKWRREMVVSCSLQIFSVQCNIHNLSKLAAAADHVAESEAFSSLLIKFRCHVVEGGTDNCSALVLRKALYYSVSSTFLPFNYVCSRRGSLRPPDFSSVIFFRWDQFPEWFSISYLFFSLHRVIGHSSARE